jgi:cytochrome c oxidase cbb3-type subunit III
MKRTFARSHFRTLALVVLLAGCEREKRSFRETPPGATAFPAVQTSELQAGPKTTDPSAGAYQENRFAVSQGQTFYSQYNCAGCHSPGGGGGMGPPLNDDEWIYGSDPENVFQTIVQGRPNGMPAFRGRIDNAQVWMLVAYVRTMSGLTPKDAWPARADHMQESRPQIDAQPQRQQP